MVDGGGGGGGILKFKYLIAINSKLYIEYC